MTTLSALPRLTIAEAAPLIRDRQLSPVELTRACIERSEALDPLLHAYLTPTFDTAMQEAQRAADEIAQGRYHGPLHGIPLALKDLFETAGVRSTAGSPLRDDHVPAEDAAVVALLKAAGAVMLGKLNMHEWALGTTNINAHYPSPHNPWDTTRVTGGSSGGSGAAIAASLCLGTLGSDTGGSIRIPASLCGITGIKPTYGRVSVRGAIPLAWSLDHAGPMARSAADCAILLDAIAGYDALDPLSVDVPAPGFAASLDRGLEGMRIAVASGFLFDDTAVSAEIAAAVRDTVAVFEKLGAIVTEMDVGELAPAEDLSIFMSEASAYHAQRVAESPEGFGPTVITRLRRSAQYTATDYASARLRQAKAKRELAGVFETVDLLLSPATVVTAPLLPAEPDEEAFVRTNGFTSSTLGRNTRPFNITGAPAISLPCGFDSAGLPIGLQLTGTWWAEATVLRAAHAYQQATDWHRRVPPVG